MTTHPRPQSEAVLVTCEVCHKEIPLSEARHFEAEDYVANFCGLECYSAWKERSETQDRLRKGPKG